MSHVIAKKIAENKEKITPLLCITGSSEVKPLSIVTYFYRHIVKLGSMATDNVTVEISNYAERLNFSRLKLWG